MSLLINGQLAQDGEFRLRVKMAMVTAAKDVAAETETTKVLYQKRFDYARQILNEPEYKLNAFAFAVASNPVITSESVDGDIQFTVNSIFSSMAGVKPSDANTEITVPA